MRRGNGEGSVIELSGKRRKPFAVRVTVGWTLEGKQKYKYVGYYEKKSEANKALREYLVNPYDLSTKNTTMLDVYKKWEDTSEIAPVIAVCPANACCILAICLAFAPCSTPANPFARLI